MIERGNPDYADPPIVCDYCGSTLHYKDRFKRDIDGSIKCQECCEFDYETVEERETRSTQEVF